MFFKTTNTPAQEMVTRYEAKYVIPRELVPRIRDFIQPFCKPDSYTKGHPPEYTITTIQLDDARFSLHRASENEMSRRFKLRVRTYGEIGSAPAFLEVKAKLDDTVVKRRVAIPFDMWNRALVFGVNVPACLESEKQILDFLHFRRLVWELDAHPTAVIRYIRESYVGTVDRYARVTFDRKLQYQLTDSWTDFGRAGFWRSMDSAEAQGKGLSCSGVIMEIKALSYTPVWVMDTVERFQLRRVGNCKYSTAIRCDRQFEECVSLDGAAEDLHSDI